MRALGRTAWGGVPTLHYPIFIEGAYLFHVVMICNRGSLETLRDLFSKFTRRVLAICSEFWRNTVNLEAPWHRALIGLINGDALTDEYLDVQLSATAIPASRQFRLLCFCFDSCKTYKERSKVVEVAKSLNNGDAYPFMYEDHLLVLYYSSSSEDAALSGRRIYADLGNHVFTPHGVACGASQVFFNIEDIPFAYRQALAAYSMRAPLKRELESLTGNAEIPCYPFEHVLKYYVLVEGRDSDLVEFSFHGSILERLAEEDKIEDTSIIQMIWVYLNSGRNATETAKMVHVHRNTVLYHVSRLEKRFDISFDSPLLRSRMLLDFQRLLLEGKI